LRRCILLAATRLLATGDVKDDDCGLGAVLGRSLVLRGVSGLLVTGSLELEGLGALVATLRIFSLRSFASSLSKSIAATVASFPVAAFSTTEKECVLLSAFSSCCSLSFITAFASSSLINPGSINKSRICQGSSILSLRMKPFQSKLSKP